MMEDIVINSYKQQIKESILKTDAVKRAGYDILIDELKKRSVNTDKIDIFFEKMKNSVTKEQLNELTIDELNSILEDVNLQITKALISPVELADTLVRKSRIIAKEKSPNGKINDNDNYVKVGANLAAEINKYGISQGISTCVKNYCIQKLYQATYREKIKERETKLGIESTEEQTSLKKNKRNIDTKKSKTMKDIFGYIPEDDLNKTFEEKLTNYFEFLNSK